MSWTVPARLVYTVTQWAQIVVLAREVDLEIVGVYGVALAWVTLVFRSLEWGIGQAAATDIAQEFDDDVYRQLRRVLLCGSILLVVGIAGVYYQFDTVGMTMLFLLIPKSVESFSTLSYGVLRREKCERTIGLSLLLRGISGFVLFSIGLVFFDSVYIGISLMGIAWLGVAYWVEHPQLQRCRSEVGDSVQGMGQVAKLARRVAPLGASGFLAYALNIVPSVLLEALHGREIVGVFTVLCYPYQAANILVLAFVDACLSPLAKELRQQRKGYSVRLLLVALVAIVACCLIGLAFVAFFGERFLGMLHGAEYATFQSVFLALGAAFCLKYISAGLKMIPNGFRLFQLTLVAQIIPFATMLTFAFIWIPEGALWGAVYVVALTNLSLLFSSLVVAVVGWRRGHSPMEQPQWASKEVSGAR